MHLARFLAFLPLVSTAVVPPSLDGGNTSLEQPTMTSHPEDLTEYDSELEKRGSDRWSGDSIEVAPGSYARWDCRHVKYPVHYVFHLRGVNWQKTGKQIRKAAKGAGAVTYWEYKEWVPDNETETRFSASFQLPIGTTKRLEKKLDGLLGFKWEKHEGIHCPHVDKHTWEQSDKDKAKSMDNQEEAKAKWEASHPDDVTERESEVAKASEGGVEPEDLSKRDSDLEKRSEGRVERWNGVNIEVAPHSYATWDCKHIEDTFYNTVRLYGNNWQRTEHQIKSAANAAGAVTKWTYVETFNKTTQETSFKSEFGMPKWSNNQLERHLSKLLGAKYGKHQGPKCPLLTAVDWNKDEPQKPVDNWAARDKWEKKHPEAAARQRKQEEQEELVKSGEMDEDEMLKNDEKDDIPRMTVERWNGDDIEVQPGEYATWNCSHQKERYWDEFHLQGVNWHRSEERIQEACNPAGGMTQWSYNEWTNEFNQTAFSAKFDLPIRKTKALEKKLNGLLGVHWKKYEGPKCTHISADGNYAPGDMAPERREKMEKAKAKWAEKHPEAAARQKREKERVEGWKEDVRKGMGVEKKEGE